MGRSHLGSTSLAAVTSASFRVLSAAFNVVRVDVTSHRLTELLSCCPAKPSRRLPRRTLSSTPTVQVFRIAPGSFRAIRKTCTVVVALIVFPGSLLIGLCELLTPDDAHCSC